MKYRSPFKTLILCQLPDKHSFQSYSQVTFPSLVGLPHSASHYSPYMWVGHTVRNVGPPHLGFFFPLVPPPSYRSLQSYSQLTFPSLVGPPHCEKCGSATFTISLSGGFATFLTLQPQLSELLETCQQWELIFLLFFFLSKWYTHTHAY